MVIYLMVGCLILPVSDSGLKTIAEESYKMIKILPPLL
jgi:hypothetical protein